MEKKYSLTLDNDIIKYCQLNNIEDIDSFLNKIIKNGYYIEKYGNSPIKNNTESVENENKKEYISYIKQIELLTKENENLRMEIGKLKGQIKNNKNKDLYDE